MDPRSKVMATIKNVAARQDMAPASFDDSLPLLETGLDSLDMAIIVAQLEDELDVDPFATEDDFVFPVTIGDFIALYERAVAQPKT